VTWLEMLHLAIALRPALEIWQFLKIHSMASTFQPMVRSLHPRLLQLMLAS